MTDPAPSWQRYAIYWLPGGALGARGAAWLGWDARAGTAVNPPVIDARKARLYGFHATLKPPFRLASDAREDALLARAEAVAAALPRVALGRLTVDLDGRFLTLRPEKEAGISALAAALVRELDGFRAPPEADELARRQRPGLSPRQADYLQRWGYPQVFEEFRPHLTLSVRGGSAEISARARDHFGALLAAPQEITAVSLLGEDAEGRFHLITDLPLGGRAARAARQGGA